MERYKTNKKLTKRKERKMEQTYYTFTTAIRCGECKAIWSVQNQRSKLRKLKKKKRWRKNEESRKLNRKFQLDTGGVTLEKISKVKRSVRDRATTRKS